MLWHTALLCGAAIGTAYGQDSSSSSSSSASTTASVVPTGTPVPGDYTGPLRPRAHFSPPQGFKNDPNGLFVWNGTYHYYYQYNPTATVAGNQHWGHATTTDGYTWVNQPIALFPPDNETFVFSGSAVVDTNNTSGLFPDQNDGVVAIYTLANYPGGVQGIQTQAIAYSRDGGYTFTPYENNPVLDKNSTNFRDPKVVWHAPTQRWVMVVALAADFVVSFYTSPNLIDWSFASNFTRHGLLGIQYECPNLVELPYRNPESFTTSSWLLFVSINPGAPLGGSIGQYFPGFFNGTHFQPMDSVTRIADFGKDNYAGQFFFASPADPSISQNTTAPSPNDLSSPFNNQLSIDWASNWQYTNLLPTGPAEGWASIATLPKETYLTTIPLVGTTLVRYPLNIPSQFSSVLFSNSSFTNSSAAISYADLPSKALWFEANVTGLTATTLRGQVNLTFTSSQSGESVRLGTNIGAEVWMTRHDTHGYNFVDNPFYTDAFSASGVYGREGEWRIAGVIDRSVLELYLNGGQQVGTMVFFPGRELDGVTISVGGVAEGTEVAVGVWGLRDAWAGREADQEGQVTRKRDEL
ncbi:Serine/threonine-protein kinase ATG1 [Sphaceloma murrayae]|uniref:Serine/threonine-protein kinase ATG1 n=1 Tax=Sphaceloma murrayae TaxID=2082308 RepID=A0A2K1R204_9PEZI|nr:Serine/threonine-protein kinase ATG1 [Sphaceloma murrayae]